MRRDDMRNVLIAIAMITLGCSAMYLAYNRLGFSDIALIFIDIVLCFTIYFTAVNGKHHRGYAGPREFEPGDIVRHFKRELVTDLSKKYLYKIVCIGRDCDDITRSVVVYEALYDDFNSGIRKGDVFIRDYNEFIGKVDRNKYPEITQEYRFEKIK